MPVEARPPAAERTLAWRCPVCVGDLGADGDELVCAACGRRFAARDGVWRFSPDLVPKGFGRDRRDHLASLDGHFWFPPRAELLCRLLDRWGGGRRAAALDAGCGAGAFLPSLLERSPLVVGVDAYHESLAAAPPAAAARAVRVQADVRHIPFAGGQFDLLCALDVLEHLEPAPFLGELRRLAAPDARLLVAVPAFPALWSEADVLAGHRRRYRRATLAAELAGAGWRLLHATHYQALLFPLTWASRRLAPARLRAVERRPGRLLGRLLGAVNRFEVAAFSNRRLPWGTSLVAVARRAA